MLLLFIPSFLAVIIKYDVSLPTKKVTGILLLIVISGSLFSACQFAYKDAKNKKAFSPYILASRFATYTPFFNLNYFALAAKSIKDYSQLQTRCRIFNYQSGIQVLIPTC